MLIMEQLPACGGAARCVDGGATMRFCVCGLIVAVVVGLTGCGGGGGGGSASLSVVPSGAIGTWKIQGLGLPNDEMGVQSDGDVVVNSETPATRGDSQTKIGICSPRGTLALSGSWRSGGVDYQISATGAVQPESHSLTLRANTTASNGAGRENADFSGDRISDAELPPPPPFDLPTDPGYELPPPPPGDEPDTPEMPPPPPSY